MFDEQDVIFSYTTEQAIEDGVLLHPYPSRWPYLLITAAVHAACLPTAKDSRTYDQRLVPLLLDAIMEVKSKGVEDAPLVLEHTVAGTVWIMPNDLGGLTVMLPSDW